MKKAFRVGGVSQDANDSFHLSIKFSIQQARRSSSVKRISSCFPKAVIGKHENLSKCLASSPSHCSHLFRWAEWGRERVAVVLWLWPRSAGLFIRHFSPGHVRVRQLIRVWGMFFGENQ